MRFYRQIKSMGTEFELCLESCLEAECNNVYKDILSLLQNFESNFSRFIPDSEINRLNEAQGEFSASSEMVVILKLAQKYYRLSDGIFNPGILHVLENIGYRKSFPFETDGLKLESSGVVGNFSDLSLNESKNIVNKPSGLKIDLGGIGKGYIVDKIADTLKTKAYQNFWISAGGDMLVSGVDFQGKYHKIGVQNPKNLTEKIIDIEISDKTKAIASSGVGKRHWMIAGKKYNHLIDPRLGTSVSNELLAVTVLADKAVDADVFAKTAFILGKEAGMGFINNYEGIEGLMIDEKLKITFSKNMIKNKSLHHE